MRTKRLFILLFLITLTTTGWAGRDFLVDADWLSEHIEDANLVVLEVRYHPHRHYTVGHIPGAIQVQRFKDLGNNETMPLMHFPTRDRFQQTLRDWGINDNSTIVLYDDARTALASRVYYLLDLYGFNMDQVKLLDGGTVEWAAFEDLSQEPSVATPGTVTLQDADPALFIEWTDVYDDVISRRAPSVVLLDARPKGMYTGEIIKHSILGGHIPGAINIVSLNGTDAQSQKWFSPEKLAELYKAIPKDKTVYAYCHDGFRMSLAYIQLKSLGYENVKLYDGGWSHWGNRPSLPVVEGDAPYSQEYEL